MGVSCHPRRLRADMCEERGRSFSSEVKWACLAIRSAAEVKAYRSVGVAEPCSGRVLRSKVKWACRVFCAASEVNVSSVGEE